MLAVFQTLRMSDSEEFFAHEGPDVCPGDACFRALSGRRGAASSQGLALSHEVVRRQTIDDMLVDTQARKVKRKRTTDLLSVKEDIGRKFLVAKRLSEGKQGWAQEWARGQFPQRCTSDQEMHFFCGRREPTPTGLEPRQAKGQTCSVGLLDKGSPGSVPRPFRIQPASVDMEGGRPGA